MLLVGHAPSVVDMRRNVDLQLQDSSPVINALFPVALGAVALQLIDKERLELAGRGNARRLRSGCL